MGIFSQDYSTMWAAVAAIGQALASILAVAALIYAMTTFKKSLNLAHYGELDRMYFDLLRIRLEYPNLRDGPNPNGKESANYDDYAFMIWNFLEAIVDRCGEDDYLCKTWYPILRAEARRHKDWFDKPENSANFKCAFRKFVKKIVNASRQPSCPG
jgi:hypothetical protein